MDTAASSTAPAHEPRRRPFAELRHDLPASVVVALVALPLCLGIALGSNAPLMAGLVTGIVGGIVVAWLSGSALAVSGPAAGLTAVVTAAIADLGSYEAFLLAVVMAGVLQIVLGIARLGVFGYYIPNSVIRGMLAAIGIILILKQIPHVLGLEADFWGDLSFLQPDGRNTFSEIWYAVGHMHLGAALIAAVAMVVLRVAPHTPLKNVRYLPAPLLAVAAGMGFNALLGLASPELAVSSNLLVEIPEVSGWSSFVVATPDFSRLTDYKVYTTAGIIGAVASIETLLCVEAIDKLDPFKRLTPTNRELKAQGIGNVLVGLLGGIPMTAVIVRGSANVNSGGRTPTSAFLHGIWLLLALLLVPGLLNMIPLAALAAVLLDVGYKLAPVGLFRLMYRKGWNLFLPFVATVVGILVTDLLVGVVIGLVVGVAFILWGNLNSAYYLHELEEHDTTQGLHEVRMELSENVTFLNKASVNRALHELPEGSAVEVDGRRSRYIDPDVLEIIHEFAHQSAPARDIRVTLTDIPDGGRMEAH